LAGNFYAGGVSPVYAIQHWPGLTTQPADTRAYTGGSCTFAVGGDFGLITPTFQWEWDDGVAIHLGPTTPSWALTALTAANQGTYWCEVTYDGVVHESAQAVLSVEDHLQITTAPLAATTQIGESHTFTVVAAGGYTPLTYVWEKDGSVIPGATGASYTTPGLGLADAGLYTVEVTDANTDSLSASAELTVTQSVSVTSVAGLALLIAALALTGACGARLTRMRIRSR
jgi:hypothetical protein